MGAYTATHSIRCAGCSMRHPVSEDFLPSSIRNRGTSVRLPFRGSRRRAKQWASAADVFLSVHPLWCGMILGDSMQGKEHAWQVPAPTFAVEDGLVWMKAVCCARFCFFGCGQSVMTAQTGKSFRRHILSRWLPVFHDSCLSACPVMGWDDCPKKHEGARGCARRLYADSHQDRGVKDWRV